MKFQHIPICILAAATLLQCSKSKESGKDPLPAAPVNCENAQGNCFRCDINGEEWVPAESGWTIPYFLDYNEEFSTLDIQFRRKVGSTTFQRINISLENFPHNPTLKIGDGNFTGFTDYNNSSPCNRGYYTYFQPNTLNIIVNDTIARIIEAECDIRLTNPDCGADSIIHISNGHFRLYY